MITSSDTAPAAIVTALLACRRALDRQKAYVAAAHVNQALCVLRIDAEKAR